MMSGRRAFRLALRATLGQRLSISCARPNTFAWRPNQSRRISVGARLLADDGHVGSPDKGQVGLPDIGSIEEVHTAEEARAAAEATGKTSLVIFDKDGTLICFHSMWTPWLLQTAEKIQAASGLSNIDVAQEVYRALGFCPVEQKVKPGVLAEGTDAMVKQRLEDLLIEHGVGSERAVEVVEHCFESSASLTQTEDTLKALHNLHELFAELKSHDIKIAVCTADSRHGTEHALKALGLSDLIDLVPRPDLVKIWECPLVVCGDDPMTEPKPSPHNALKICQALGVDPKEAYMVGDTLADVHMGRSAKLAGSVAVLSGVASRAELAPHSDHVIDHVGHLLPIVTRKAKKGFVSACRLSENPDFKVVLLEAGPRDDWWNWKIHMPAALMYNLCDDNYNWYYHTLPQEHMNSRIMYWPRGRVWGGSSALNAMCYVRGHPLDYDRWTNQDGCGGWSFANCLPYFKRAEEFRTAPDSGTEPNGPFRGSSGPLKVTQGHCDNELHHAWMASGLQAGFGYTSDMNGFRQEGLARMDMTIDKGVRSSASRAYLTKEVLSRPNLYVSERILTTKVLFDGRKAIGVEFVRVTKGVTFGGRSETIAPSMTGVNSGNREKLYTQGEVILAGGAINTPQLMLLSGLGPGAELKEFDIPVLQDMPGVGANLQDHLEIYVQHRCTQPITLYDKSSWRFPHNMVKIGLQWFYNQTGLGATSHLESGGFIRSEPNIPHPDIQFHFLPSLVHDHGRRAPVCHGYQVHVGPMRPQSSGTLKLFSTDPRHAPLIDANYLSTERDRYEFRMCIKAARELMSQKAFAPFTGGELAPGKECQSDEQLDEFVRSKADSAYHPSCTCKMGPASDSSSVVAPDTLQVHGLDSLRIVDASIMPSIVSGNLNAPVIMMAEKASDVIMGRKPLPADNVRIWHPKSLDSDRENSEIAAAPQRLRNLADM